MSPRLLEQGTRWLIKQRDQHVAGEVTYRRGDTSVTLPATPGKTVFRLDDLAGGAIRLVSHDFLIAADNLVLDGLPVQPQRGDLLVQDQGDRRFTHEVLPFADREPAWRYGDPGRTTYRIHTKLIHDEALPAPEAT